MAARSTVAVLPPEPAKPAALENPVSAVREPELPACEKIDEPRQVAWDDARNELTDESDDLALEDEYEIEEILEDDDLEDDGEPSDFGEAYLGYGALRERLRWKVLPHLRLVVERNGQLTLGNLCYAVQALQGSAPHLEEVRAYVRHCGVPVLESRVNRRGFSNSRDLIELTQSWFGDLVRGRPREETVLRRLGYERVHLSPAERELLMQAWMHHRLARVEEEYYCEVVAREVERVGDDIRLWSRDALAACEELVLDNLWLVGRVVCPYLDHGLDLEDLYQEGVCGLFRAVVKYDASKAHRFMAYAASWIWQRITRAIADDARVIRLPVHMHEQLQEFRKARAELEARGQIEPTVAELANALSMPQQRVRWYLALEQPVLSLDVASSRELVSGLSSFDWEQMEDEVERAELPGLVAVVLEGLTDRDRRVLELRFGLGGHDVHTLEETGAQLGVTRERVRQIEAKVIKKLQGPKLQRELFAQGKHSTQDDRLRLPVLAPALVSKVLPSFPEMRERLAVTAMFLQPERRPGSLDRTLTDLNLTRSDAEALADRVKTLTDEWYRVNVLRESYKTPQTTQVEGSVS